MERGEEFSKPADGLTRREFLVGSAAAAAVAAARPFLSAARAWAGPVGGSSRVVIVTHPKIFARGYQLDPAVLKKVMDAGIEALTGKDNAKAGWKQILGEARFVTCKYNQLGGPNIRTRPQIVEFVRDVMVATFGLDPKKGICFGRGELRGEYARWSEPFTLPTSGVRTRLRRVLTEFNQCLINLPVLKTHSHFGVTIAMKNHLGSNDNPGALHNWNSRGREMWKSIPELNAIPAIRRRTRLIIVDATRPLYDGGPGDNPARRWQENALIFATDPVAVDAVGVDILERKRRQLGLKRWQLVWGRSKVRYAQKLGLGIADLKRIKVQTLKLR